MKIHQSEIEAGAKAYCQNRFANGDKAIVWNDAIKAAIEAAYRVRKERKKQKREKAKHKGISVGSPFFMNEIQALMNSTPPKPLTFEAGKSYRTRDGRKSDVNFIGTEYIVAIIDGAPYNFHMNGLFVIRLTGGTHPLDLIAPWTES